MPLMPLVEKFIREHGSASISKDLIELLREEARIADKQHAQEIEDLKKAQAEEVARLNQNHAVEMAYLERRIEALQKPQAPPEPQFDEQEIAIVRQLASVDSIGDEELAQHFGLPLTTVKYHLNNLEKKDVARSSSYAPSIGNLWNLTENGIAFAVKNSLVVQGASPRRRQWGRY